MEDFPLVSAIFDPISAAIFFATSLLLQYLFPQKIEGPRASNLKVSTARYGDLLARVHGRAKIAGRAIWLKGGKIDEIATTRRAGGLFGLPIGPEITEYTYLSTFAIAFTDHEIHAIPRLWFDGLLVYDNTKEALDNALAGEGQLFAGKKGLRFRLYRGTMDQRPDRLLAADVGADEAEAYPGTSYIVVENWNHEETGIRLPDVEAEIVAEADDDFNVGSFSNAGSGLQSSTEFGYTSDYHAGQGLTGNLSSSGNLHVWRTQDRTRLWSVNLITRGDFSGQSRGLIFDGAGHLLLEAGGSIYAYDAFTSKLLETLPGLLSSAVATRVHRVGMQDQFQGVTRTWTFFLKGTGGAMVRSVGGAFTGESITINSPGSNDATGMAIRATDRTIWVAGPNGLLYETGPAAGASDAATETYDLSGFIGDTIQGVAYVEADDTLILIDSANERLVKVEADDPTEIVATYAAGNLPTTLGAAVWSRRMPADDGRFVIVDVGQDGENTLVRLIDAISLTEDETWPRSEWGSDLQPYDDWVYDAATRAVWMGAFLNTVTPRLHIFLPRVPDGTIPRAQIIEDECALVGLTVDVTGVTGTEIGYPVRDDAPPRTVLEDLMRVRAIDCAQIDGVLTFWDKASTPARTLSLDHMGARQDGRPGTSQVVEEPGDPFDLPEAIVLEYIAYEAQYRSGAQRIGIPEGFEVAGGNLRFETSLVMEADDAAQAADRILQEARDIRQGYRANMLPRDLDLHPGVVVTLPLDADRSVVAVMSEMTQDMVIEARFHRRNYDYASDALGAPTPDTIPRQINLAPAIFLPLDIPILSDDDDDASFYWGLYTVEFGSFTSASLYRSLDDGQTWAFYASVDERAGVGAALTALPDHRPWMFDRTNSLVVRSYTGELAESVTEAEARNGSNTFAIQAGDEWEIVNVATITDLGGGFYRFSDIIRGRDGSESFTGDHAAGDLVVRLDSDAIVRSADTTSKDVAAVWIARTLGIPLDPSRVQEFTNEARGKRPRAPYPVRGARDTAGDLDITWRRCTRLKHGWLGGDAPLGEESEAYEVEIYDGSTLLRTIEDLTSPEAAYTLAQYQADSGIPGASEIPQLEVKVYQISATFGRGLPGIKTV